MISSLELLMHLTYKTRRQHKDYERQKRILSPIGFWKEMGAVILTAPRISGKSTVLRKFGKWLRNNQGGECVVFNAFTKKHVSQFPEYESRAYRHFHQYDHKNMHLLIDEYDYVKQEHMNSLLSYPWKNVIMVGTYGGTNGTNS